MQAQTIGFTLDGVTAREANSWSISKISPRANGWEGHAKTWARKHGVAVGWRLDGALIMFYMDNGKLRRKSWPSAKPVRIEK